MNFKSIFSSCALLCFALTGFNAHAANFQGLSFMGDYAEMHPTALNVYVPFFEKIKADTNGEVSFNLFAANTLYPDSEAYAALSDGRVDFGTVRAAAYPGVMNLATVADIPGMVPNAIVGSLVAYDVLEKFPVIASEFPKNALPYSTWTSSPLQYHSRDPLGSLEELKGKKVIVWNPAAMDLALALGANPMRIVSADTYMSLSKGMADAVIAPLAPIRSYKITDITKNHFLFNLSVVTFNLMISEYLWDEFTPEIKDAILAEGGAKFSIAAGKSLYDADNNDRAWMQENGHSFVERSSADEAIADEVFEQFKAKWLKDMETRGHGDIASEILAYTEERATYYTAEFEKGAYTN